jgi:hypothetical protein
MSVMGSERWNVVETVRRKLGGEREWERDEAEERERRKENKTTKRRRAEKEKGEKNRGKWISGRVRRFGEVWEGPKVKGDLGELRPETRWDVTTDGKRKTRQRRIRQCNLQQRHLIRNARHNWQPTGKLIGERRKRKRKANEK